MSVYCNGIFIENVYNDACDVDLGDEYSITLNNFDGGSYYFGNIITSFF